MPPTSFAEDDEDGGDGEEGINGLQSTVRTGSGKGENLSINRLFPGLPCRDQRGPMTFSASRRIHRVWSSPLAQFCSDLFAFVILQTPLVLAF